MELIKQLKDEHKEILYLISSLESGIKSGRVDSAEFLNQVTELKELLVNHLSVEDKLLYPQISQSKSSEVKIIGDTFSTQMAEIAKKAMQFFGEYQSVPVSELVKNQKFLEDFKEISAKIKERVKIEESVLFNAYLKSKK